MNLLALIRTACLSFFLLPLIACAEAGNQADRFQAGVHYALIAEPVKTRNPKKIEVVEIFWYGCSHCFSFEPQLHKWAATLADDVDFWQSPAMWRENMVVHARAYFAAQQLGKLDTLHQPIFDALNIDRNPLADEAAVGELFAKHGISDEEFKKAYHSFAVTSGVRLADQRARKYKITGTPEMVVNGKYRISARMAGGTGQMLEVADFLINKERAAR